MQDVRNVASVGDYDRARKTLEEQKREKYSSLVKEDGEEDEEVHTTTENA